MVNDNDVLRIAVRQRLEAGQDHVNVYYVKANFGTSADNLTVGNAIEAHYDLAYSQLNPYISTLVSKVDMKIDKVVWTGGQMVITENIGTFPWVSLNYVPGSAGEMLPPGVAALVKFLTNVGKTFARKFIGGAAEGQQANGNLHSVYITALLAFAAQVLADIVIASVGILEAGTMSERSFQFEEFVATEVAEDMAYQRRRRPGTGS